MKGTIVLTLPNKGNPDQKIPSDTERFRVAAHFAGASIQDHTEAGEDVRFDLTFTDIMAVWKLRGYYVSLSDDQVNRFLEAEKAMKAMAEIRQELI